MTVDSKSKMTVVTQFITSDGTDSGALSEIKRIYHRDRRYRRSGWRSKFHHIRRPRTWSVRGCRKGEEFYGPGMTVDSKSKMTVVTQFITSDGTDSGALSEITHAGQTTVLSEDILIAEGLLLGCAEFRCDRVSGGPGMTVDSKSKMTVVTQFITSDGTDSGALSEIKRDHRAERRYPHRRRPSSGLCRIPV
jgi:uncharacterized protein YheU (UPF0270 family)